MSITVDQAWVAQFNDTLLATYQQDKSLLENLISPMMVHRGVRAAIDHHERLSNVIANDLISRHAATVILNPAHSRRAVTLQTSDGAVLLDNVDVLRMLIKPQNAYMKTIVSALGRRADLHILAAALGSAQTAAVTAGTGVITYGTQALPSAQKIGTNTAMSLTRIINATEILSKNGVPTGPKNRLFLYGPGQLRDVMAITQASSSDFTKNQIHDVGTINGVDWEGYRWIEIADVVDITGTVTGRMLALPASDKRSCIAMSTDAVGLSIGEDIKQYINERADLSNAIQVRAEMTMGATRAFDTGVVQVDALEN